MDDSNPTRETNPETIKHNGPVVGSSGYLRLFLDDDPARADAFLDKFPDAHWVETAADCIAALAEQAWDEIHLDHDLEGEWFVDSERDDCGMEVVRWLTSEPRSHLMAAKFVVHTHNQNAAMVMVTQLGLAGYYVLEQPFGSAPSEKNAPDVGIFQPQDVQPAAKTRKTSSEPLKEEEPSRPSLIRRILRWFVPPPTVNTPWQNAPGGMRPGPGAGPGQKQGWGMPGHDILDPDADDDSDDRPGPYVLPIQPDEFTEQPSPRGRREESDPRERRQRREGPGSREGRDRNQSRRRDDF